MKTEDIIVVEDNDTMRIGIVDSLCRSGYTVSAFSNGTEALKHCETVQPLAAILDLRMEPLNGIEILEKLKQLFPSCEALMISAYGTVDDAVKAMRLGAADFMTKPFSPDELRLKVNKIFTSIQNKKKIESLIEHNSYLADQNSSGYEEIIGCSVSVKAVISLVEQVAGTDSNILIHGESGTGKEVIARAIHKNSKRSQQPFIKINCGSLNDNLLESELFGHEKGAFTGAIKKKKGRFELADKGSLFLDEVGDVSATMQVKLLRVLQEKEFERLGGEETLKTDIRIIAATNRDLIKLVRDSKFREDLFYRLNVIPIELPPLRDRSEDIPLLINHFLLRQANRNHGVVKTIDEAGISSMRGYSWPGNIRELENLIERLYVISAGSIIDNSLIAAHLNITSPLRTFAGGGTLDESVTAFEKDLIINAMQKSEGVKNRAAKLLGVSPSLLFYKLEKHGLL